MSELAGEVVNGVTAPVEGSTVAAPNKISVEDQQGLEIAHLRLENLKLQESNIKASLHMLGQQRAKFQKELQERAEELQMKYGLVVGRDKIMPDGTIVTVPTTAS